MKLPRYPVIGATLIGRLARDVSFRGQGVGELLLLDVLKVSLKMSRQIASAAVVVDAKDGQARGFYMGFGFVAFGEHENRLLLRMDLVERLFAINH
jgi:predicted GNAT family N-acyltransferase